MAIQATDPASSTTNISPSPSASSKSALDKDAFMKLLVAQISHQDPMKPMEGTEFVAQLSQFAMVEQAIAQSSKLDLVSTQLRGLGNSEATALVGKSVAVRGHGIAFDGVLATSSSVSLSGGAQKVTASIRDASGAVVRTIDLGPQGAGPVSVKWDGKDDNGQPVKAGSYSLDVSATAADGTPVAVTQDVSGVVTKVSFDKGYAELTLSSGVTAPISDLVSVEGASAPR